VTRRILAVDTTSEFGSIALISDGQLVDQVQLHSPGGFAHVLFAEIERMLSNHGISLQDIGIFASASGPGAFTGVRVGLAAVKGLAEATGRRVNAISNLQALASFGSRPFRAVILDARRGEIFGAVYNDALELVRDEVVMKLDAFLSSLPAGGVEFITAGYALPGVGPVMEAPRWLAGAIGKIAASRFDLAQDPAAIDANYVRRSDAELLWKE
jgi:tRNA threonylcarbamoyladenosine biosynthesis protein TsaB